MEDLKISILNNPARAHLVMPEVTRLENFIYSSHGPKEKLLFLL